MKTKGKKIAYLDKNKKLVVETTDLNLNFLFKIKLQRILGLSSSSNILTFDFCTNGEILDVKWYRKNNNTDENRFFVQKLIDYFNYAQLTNLLKSLLIIKNHNNAVPKGFKKDKKLQSFGELKNLMDEFKQDDFFIFGRDRSILQISKYIQNRDMLIIKKIVYPIRDNSKEKVNNFLDNLNDGDSVFLLLPKEERVAVRSLFGF